MDREDVWTAVLERVKRKQDLGDGAFAAFAHKEGDIQVTIPIEQWKQMGRPNSVRVRFLDGGAHGPLGA